MTSINIHVSSTIFNFLEESQITEIEQNRDEFDVLDWLAPCLSVCRLIREFVMYASVRCHIHSQGTIIHKGSRFPARLLRNIGDWLILPRYASDKFRISTNKDVAPPLGANCFAELWSNCDSAPLCFRKIERFKIREHAFLVIRVHLRFINWENKDRYIYTIAAPPNSEKLRIIFASKGGWDFVEQITNDFEGWIVLLRSNMVYEILVVHHVLCIAHCVRVCNICDGARFPILLK